MTAITAITAQNTVGVRAIHPIPPEIVLAQVRAVVEDIGVDAVKVGMLGSAPVTRAVAAALRELPPGTPVVVDPVMVAESGARLLEPDAQSALVEEVLPLATVATPNVPEAHVLAGAAGPRAGEPGAAASEAAEPDAVASDAVGSGDVAPDGAASEAVGTGDVVPDAMTLARAVLALGPRCVVLTGGHRETAADLFLDSAAGAAAVEIPGERHADGAAHGSGCTHSSVLAAQLALGCSALEAARTARRLAGEAVASGLRDVGVGAGPVDIFGLGRLRGDIIGER